MQGVFMNTAEKILNLIKESGLTDAAINKATGLTAGLITQWRKGAQKPSADAIVKIATYFNVTTDYLLGLSEAQQASPSGLSMDEQRLVDGYRQLDDQGKRYVWSLLGVAPESAGVKAAKK